MTARAGDCNWQIDNDLDHDISNIQYPCGTLMAQSVILLPLVNEISSEAAPSSLFLPFFLGDHSTGVWVGGSDNGHVGRWAWFPTGECKVRAERLKDTGNCSSLKRAASEREFAMPLADAELRMARKRKLFSRGIMALK